MTHSLPRLRAILTHLPLNGVPPRLLNAGCGDFPSLKTLRAALPGWMILALDRDGPALHRARRALQNNPDPALHLIQADARDLLALFRPVQQNGGFGLIMIRHPDLFRNRAIWEQTIPALPDLLAPGGVLLITLYAPEEAEIIRALDLPRPLTGFDNGLLPRVDLAGRDRFVRVYGR
jgi:SAM-dependent methyltransferase